MYPNSKNPHTTENSFHSLYISIPIDFDIPFSIVNGVSCFLQDILPDPLQNAHRLSHMHFSGPLSTNRHPQADVTIQLGARNEERISWITGMSDILVECQIQLIQNLPTWWLGNFRSGKDESENN